MEIKTPKKLIEVALPLDDINEASSKEKNNPFLKAHPRNLHLWWARRPLATARAVLFAQMVNDPGYERNLQRGLNKEKAAIERDRLFAIIKKLVQWENINNEEVLKEAREEIWKSWRETCALNKNHPQAAELFNPDKLPAFHDPFAGGGAIPLEAQRLGLESYASDLNPVAVLINKALIEIPPKFAGRPPVGSLPKGAKQSKLHEDWSGTKGIAEDVRRYGKWMCDEAFKRIGHLYPQIEITNDIAKDREDLKPFVGLKRTVTAWLWARTVKSPNPAFSHQDVPLVTSFVLSNKTGKEVWLEPIKAGDSYRFVVRLGKPPEYAYFGTKLARGGNFRCLLSDSPIDSKHIRNQGTSGGLGLRLMAIVAEGNRGNLYLSPTREMESITNIEPSWKHKIPMPNDPRAFTPILYGFSSYGSLFTSRELMALETFSDLVIESREKIRKDVLSAGWADDGRGLENGGTKATAYADAIAMYLGMAISQYSRFFVSFAIWNATNQNIAHGFGRQAIPVTWDFPEPNPLLGNLTIETALGWIAIPVEKSMNARGVGHVIQADARTVKYVTSNVIISTDPPYYDNVPYADLSDFFYGLLRRSLKSIFPSLFATVATPKEEELVAAAYRQGGRDPAEQFFLSGMTNAMHNIALNAHPAFPVTIYYAFKQAETGKEGTSSTGWETFLEAVLRAELAITGTWPMHTERAERMRGKESNALASSIILVCRKRNPNAPSVSRREFIRELNTTLPEALVEMTSGGINSPVAATDLSQAIIGPGMAIFSKYAAVLEADGTPMTVRTALTLINRFLAEDDFDHDTQFCLHWFETNGWSEGRFGEADVLARAKGTSVDGVQQAGVLESGKGDVRLLRYGEYPTDWNPESDTRTPVWEAMHHLIRTLQSGGETESGRLLAKMPSRMESIRQLAYRLYTLCERKGWAEDARAYNELIASRQAIEKASLEVGHVGTQPELGMKERP